MDIEFTFDKTTPSMVADLPIGKLRVFAGVGIDGSEVPLDIILYLRDGRRLGATVSTLESLRTIMTRYRTTGECHFGLYLWVSDLIIVDRLDNPAIAEVVLDLHRTGEIESAMVELAEMSDEEHVG